MNLLSFIVVTLPILGGAFVLPTHFIAPVRRIDLSSSSSPSSPLWGKSIALKAASLAAPPQLYDAGKVQTGDYLQGMDRYNWQTLPEVFETMATIAPKAIAVEDPIHKPTAKLTYAELNKQISQLAAFFQSNGLAPGKCVSIFSENSHRWLAIDQAVLRAGGCNAVRGVKAPIGELQYIYSNSESVICVVESPDQIIPLMRTGEGLASGGVPPRYFVVLFPGDKTGKEIQEEAESEVQVVTYDEMLAAGADLELTPVPKDIQSVATLVYTSGTTNQPKGVLLRHANLLHQVNYNTFGERNEADVNPRIGDILVSVLPCWHIFERTAEYWMYSKGIHVVYSNVKNFKTDLAKFKPHFLVAVPRLFETIYRGVQQKFASEKGAKAMIIKFFKRVNMAYVKAMRIARGLVLRERPPNPIEKLAAFLIGIFLSPLAAIGDKLVWSKVREGLGGRIKVMVAGGSSMPLVLEDFFEMIKTPVIVGYGMTETSPVITNRIVESNLAGSVGRPAKDTEIKIADLETGKRLPIGKPGVVLMKGPQMMGGYKSNPEATKKAFDEEGFLDTGDIGRINPGSNHLVITGRAKDTIVLSNGENVEPQPIEDVVCAKSNMIDQLMCVGQDQKQIGALVVPNCKTLARKGLMDPALAEKVSQILGSQVLTNGIVGSIDELKEIEKTLQGDKKIRKALLDDISKHMAKDNFQDFERVGELQVILEPFNMANGFLTQTLKIKRNVVADHYAADIEQMYK